MTRDRTALLAALPVAAVAAIAAVQSYNHIVALALRAHQDSLDAHLLPFSIDGLITAGVAVLVAGYGLGWLSVALGVAATVFANVMSGLPYGPLAASVAAWPAIAFSVASFVLEKWIKSQAGQERPAAAGAGPCGHTVAGTAEENVVQAYLHARDCEGQVPSQRSLAARFGISRPKVAELVGALNGAGPQED